MCIAKARQRILHISISKVWFIARFKTYFAINLTRLSDSNGKLPMFTFFKCPSFAELGNINYQVKLFFYFRTVQGFLSFKNAQQAVEALLLLGKKHFLVLTEVWKGALHPRERDEHQCLDHRRVWTWQDLAHLEHFKSCFQRLQVSRRLWQGIVQRWKLQIYSCLFLLLISLVKLFTLCRWFSFQSALFT